MEQQEGAKTVRVRIAVAVDATGQWSAMGWPGADDEQKMDLAVDSVGENEARYWIEADLALPAAPTLITDARVIGPEVA